MMPDAYYHSIYDINYKKYKKLGYKHLFFDVDNTLLRYSDKNIKSELVDLFEKIKKDFDIELISNGSGERRKRLSKKLGVNAYFLSFKPFNFNYKKIFKKYEREKCIFIGDQFVTDFLGAKRNKCKMIIVDSIERREEPISTKFFRLTEKIYLIIIKKNRIFIDKQYYDNINE